MPRPWKGNKRIWKNSAGPEKGPKRDRIVRIPRRGGLRSELRSGQRPNKAPSVLWVVGLQQKRKVDIVGNGTWHNHENGLMSQTYFLTANYMKQWMHILQSNMKKKPPKLEV